MLSQLKSIIEVTFAAILMASALEVSAQALPYGPPISIDNAKKVSAAALAESRKNNWTHAVAITDPAGILIYFERMDGGQNAAQDVAPAKARSAALFRRPTKAFQDDVAAGGIGLAPLRSVMYHAFARRGDFGEVVLLLGTRTPRDICFKGELRRWSARRDLQVHVTVDHVVGRWRGNVGVVTKLIPHARFDPANTIALMCGPEVMMRFTALELQNRGVPFERIYASLERNMRCAVGLCGHCQFGPTFICKDGPVFRYDRVKPLLAVREL